MVAVTRVKLDSSDGLRKVIKAHADSSGKVKLSRFGTSLSIVAVEKNGDTKEVPIVPSSRPDKFLALFQQDDVDFRVVVDNSKSPRRHARYNLKLLKEQNSFVVPKARIGNLSALEALGGKFHFLRKSSEEGESCIGTFAAKHNLSFQEASHVMSHLEFQMDYSEQLRNNSIDVIINCFDGKEFLIEMDSSDTVEDLKSQIAKDWGFEVEKQRLIFQGKLLQDVKTLMDCGVVNSSEIHMVLELHGGRGDMVSSMEEEEEATSGEDTDTTVALPRSGISYKGERGIVVFGAKSDQGFVRTRNYFRRGADIGSVRFVIELRRAPEFRLSSSSK